MDGVPRGRVLLVDDDPSIVQMTTMLLERAGYNVRSAHSGEEALLRIEEEEPDLIVLDWMLPKVSGIEVCRRLRGREATRQLPILMVTARGEERDRVRGFDTGADDYLVKPFSPIEMMARVRARVRLYAVYAYLVDPASRSALSPTWAYLV